MYRCSNAAYQANPVFGLLNLNKPAGWTSRDVVNRVERLVGPARAGHAGTLDPLATGVLVVCVGTATRLIQHVQRLPKRYVATFLLGRRSPSDDVELEPEIIADAPRPSIEEIEQAIPGFIGDLNQTPPIYSAIKVAGQTSYNLARQGESFSLPPRPVTVYQLSVIRYDYPELVLDIHCGSGFYVRALGRDLAASLGTGAVMSGLVRTAIGQLRVEQAVAAEALLETPIAERLISPRLLFKDEECLFCNEAELEELRFGRPVTGDCPGPGDGPWGVIGPDGRLAAMVRLKPDGKLWPKHVFEHAHC
ncbi:tRNA pseudouridine synthase B [Pirellulimonas nuda]|uniref:tRNA pseudouridine synthase B n=1 Tax=Pirellulimonas nuda TaxID=2528009 RepID=A0A518DHU1_9BACT|nr:tRNA pseudouridine(55) synthase TruB [Pirellulimonas nuda]QDU91051.1 tRNA pseudouridine synthase B [Pirellulimonas nuda]